MNGLMLYKAMCSTLDWTIVTSWFDRTGSEVLVAVSASSQHFLPCFVVTILQHCSRIYNIACGRFSSVHFMSWGED